MRQITSHLCLLVCMNLSIFPSKHSNGSFIKPSIWLKTTISFSSCAEVRVDLTRSLDSLSLRLFYSSTSKARGKKGWKTSPNLSGIKYNDASTCCDLSELFFVFMDMALHHIFITSDLILNIECFIFPLSKI